MPRGEQFKHILVSGCNRPLISLSFPHLQVHLKQTSPWSHKAICFCISQFWFLLAGGRDVVDRLYLKRALVIARSARWLCSWQMGPEYWECSGPPHTPSAASAPLPALYYLLANLKRSAWHFISFLNLQLITFMARFFPTPFTPSSLYIFGIKKILKMLVQAGMNGCQQFLQTC